MSAHDENFETGAQFAETEILANMLDTLEYLHKEAVKALDYLQEELPKQITAEDLRRYFFRFTFFFADVVEYEGAALLAYKTFPNNGKISEEFKKAAKLHEAACRFRDSFDDQWRDAMRNDR